MQNSIIHMLFQTEKDRTLKYSTEIENILKDIYKLDEQIQNDLEKYPEIQKKFTTYNYAVISYINKIEYNAYAHGFKSGMKIASESAID